MAQIIKYESTKIDPTQSATEIANLVQKYGGSRFELRWNEYGQLEGIRFAIRTEGIGEVPVRLQAQIQTIEEILWEARGPRSRKSRQETQEQARRIAWRQLKDFVEQALLAVETGLFPIGAAFMAEFLTRRGVLESGERGVRLLAAGEAPQVYDIREGTEG